MKGDPGMNDENCKMAGAFGACPVGKSQASGQTVHPCILASKLRIISLYTSPNCFTAFQP